MQNVIDYANIDKTVELISQGENVFITGPAGTGKSFILSELKKIFNSYITLTATTGVAASNIGGMTYILGVGFNNYKFHFRKYYGNVTEII